MAHHDIVEEPRDPADYTGADAQYFETPPGAGYEHTDANVWVIVRFGVWLVVAAVIVHFGLGFMYRLLIAQTNSQETTQYPMAAAAEQPVPPEPRLQQFPSSDMGAFRSEEDARLRGYGWVNKDAGIVRIPVEEAMKKVLQNGSLASRPADAAKPAETPGMMATDSSSGRLMERRRQ
jgi:hypothetical protein